MSLDNTYINLDGKKFIAKLDDDPVWSRNGFDEGLLFRIKDKNGETLGCLSAFLSITTKAIWGNKSNWDEELTKEVIKNLFIRVLPYVPFPLSINDFTSIYPECISLYITPSETKYIPEYKAQDLRSRGNPDELVKYIVFGGEIDDDKVQKDILTYLYEVHLKDKNEFVDTYQMAKVLFVDPDTLFRCIDYLKDDGYVDGHQLSGTPGLTYLNITTPGVRYVKNNFQTVSAGLGVIVMGDYIGRDRITTTISGDGNQTNVKSNITNSFNMKLVYERVDKLKEAIENEYKGIDKQLLVEQVEEIKMLASEKENFPKIRELLGNIITRTSQFAGIGSFAATLFKLFTSN